MAALRPLVREKGRTRQWRVADALAGVPTARIGLQDGTTGRIPLDENGELPLVVADGTKTAVPVCGVFHG